MNARSFVHSSVLLSFFLSLSLFSRRRFRMEKIKQWIAVHACARARGYTLIHAEQKRNQGDDDIADRILNERTERREKERTCEKERNTKYRFCSCMLSEGKQVVTCFSLFECGCCSLLE